MCERASFSQSSSWDIRRRKFIAKENKHNFSFKSGWKRKQTGFCHHHHWKSRINTVSGNNNFVTNQYECLPTYWMFSKRYFQDVLKWKSAWLHNLSIPLFETKKHHYGPLPASLKPCCICVSTPPPSSPVLPSSSLQLLLWPLPLWRSFWWTHEGGSCLQAAGYYCQ